MANDEQEKLTSLDRLQPPVGRASAAQPEYESPTLVALEPQRRPKPLPICATCPHSLWSASVEHLRCFCRLMRVVTWSSEEPSSPITACDGILLSAE